MKAIVMADGFVGSAIVRWLIDSHREMLSAVVVTEINTTYELCKSNDVKVHVFSDEQKLVNWIAEILIVVDVVFLAWWPYILKKEILSFLSAPIYNTHPSYLPFNRGKNYNFWAIVEESPFGVSIHRVDKGIDTGAIVAQERINYGWEDNGGTLFEKAQHAMIDLFKNNFNKIINAEIIEVSQDLSKGSFHYSDELDIASRIELEKCYTARELINLLRAKTFSGKPACYFIDNGQRYEVRIQIDKVAHDG